MGRIDIDMAIGIITVTFFLAMVLQTVGIADIRLLVPDSRLWVW